MPKCYRLCTYIMCVYLYQISLNQCVWYMISLYYINVEGTHTSYKTEKCCRHIMLWRHRWHRLSADITVSDVGDRSFCILNTMILGTE